MIDYENSGLDEQQIERWKALGGIFGAKTFLPNRPQYEFIKAVGQYNTLKKKIFLLRSGNGVGKTTVVWNVLANIIYGQKYVSVYRDIKDVQTGEVIDGFFNHSLYNYVPRSWPRVIWYVSNKDSLEGINNEMYNWMPKDRGNGEMIKESKEGKTFVSKLHFVSMGWKLYYKTIDQDPRTFESANVSIIVFDEPPPKRLFHASVSRLRRGGIILMPATPLWDAGWFMDTIIEKVGKEQDKWDQQVSVWENCIEKAGEWDLGELGIHPKGNLYKKDIDFQIANYDEDEREARVYGKMMNLSGLIIKNYVKENVFVPVEYIKTHPKRYCYRFVIDPHDRRPPFACWMRLDPGGDIEIIREWPSLRDPQFHGKYFHDIKDAGILTIDDFVKIFSEIESELKIPKDRIDDVIDPNFGLKRNSKTGKRVFEDFQEASRRIKGFREYAFYTHASDNLVDGHSAIRQILKPTNSGHQQFRISNECHNIDRAFRRYAWKKEPPKTEDTHGIGEKIQEKYKDPIDVIRYCLIVPWDYKPLDIFKGESGADYGFDRFEDKTNGRHEATRRRIRERISRPAGVDGI